MVRPLPWMLALLLCGCQQPLVTSATAGRGLLAVDQAAFTPLTLVSTSEGLVVSSAADRKALVLTLYRNGGALVQDVRQVNLPGGRQRLRFDDVPKTIDATSVSLVDPTGTDAFALLEQTYNQALITPAKLLEAYVGKQVRIRMPAEGNQPSKVVEATLISTNEGPVYRIDGEIHLQPPGEVILPELPQGLTARPTLSWLLNVRAAIARRLEARYLAGNLSWQADYTLVLKPQSTQGRLSALATLSNTSGSSFADARLTLVAGELNRGTRLPGPMPYEAAAPTAAGAVFTEQPLGDYHAYTLGTPVSLDDGQTKQLPFFPESTIRLTRAYVLEAASASQDAFRPVQSVVRFDNSTEAGLGHALPAGRVRIYEDNPELGYRLLGEDQLVDTPVNGKVRLGIGAAFDLTAQRKQTEQKQVSEKVRQEAYEVTLKNETEQTATVEVVEHPYGDWQVLDSSVSYQRESTSRLVFPVAVPAHGQAVLRYRLQITSP